MVDNQVAARRALEKLGFHKEAVLPHHAMNSNGTKRDLMALANDVSRIWAAREALNPDCSPHSGALTVASRARACLTSMRNEGSLAEAASVRNRWQMANTRRLRVALLQMVSHGLDQAANLEKGNAFCRKAAQMDADIALFPEMWNVGSDLGDSAVWAGAITRNQAFYSHFQALAQGLRMAVALTFLERGSDGPQNTLSLIDRTGAEVLAYSKVHTCAFDKEAPLVRGSSFPVATLTTAGGEIRLGAMICYDREFPESTTLDSGSGNPPAHPQAA